MISQDHKNQARLFWNNRVFIMLIFFQKMKMKQKSDYTDLQGFLISNTLR